MLPGLGRREVEGQCQAWAVGITLPSCQLRCTSSPAQRPFLLLLQQVRSILWAVPSLP